MTEPIQLELPTDANGQDAHAEADVAWLEKLLLEAKGWMTAAEILQAIGRPVTDDNKRWIRNVASRAEFILSGPGSPGYKHMRNCEIEDVVHYARALIAQGREMVRRGIRLIRNAHRLIG
jgi:hypothetical protein